MHCPHCNFENPAGMKFCGRCGRPLEVSCAACGFANPPAFKFCGRCGASLATNPEPSPNPAPAQAERRQLTVMFCDVVGSTALSEQLDPEELREVIEAYQQTAVQAVNRFGGTVAQYLGDGILVYFGYPAAHENDAQRAVLAGLQVVGQMAALNRRLQQTINRLDDLAVRVGIHTGLVVVGQVGAGDTRVQLAIGETTNVAARLQSLARPNSVVISPSTLRLVQGFFVIEPAGEHTLKGIRRPMPVYRVVQEAPVPTRLHAALAAGPAELTPLVGREQETALLLSRWEQAQAGRGQVVLLGGEAGIGKSRLVQVLRERLAGQPHIWLDCYGSPHHQNTALHPFIELLQRLAQFLPADTPAEKQRKLAEMLERFDLHQPETARFFAQLLSLPLPDDDPPPRALSPQRQKQQTLQALLAVLLHLTRLQSVLLVIEDLHWIDPSTLEMLDTLVEQTAGARLLVLFTYRPRFTPPWSSHSAVTQLALTRLTPAQIEQMARAVAGNRALPDALLAQVARKTDGVPIFIEEMTKLALEQNAAEQVETGQTGPELDIPATLQDLLVARLDRLATVREVAQLAATLGREFDYALLREISPLDESALRQDLARLVQAELLYQQGLPPDATYTFKHALIQEAAYQLLLKRDRRRYHRKIARALIARFPDTAQAQPERVAHHFTAAQEYPDAVRWWQAAGTQAAAHSANVEAVSHFRRALELLAQLPPSAERTQTELGLRIALGSPLLMTRGYAAADVEENYAAALELGRQQTESPQLLPALFGLWLFYLLRAHYATAQELSDQILRVARQTGEAAHLLGAYQAQGITLFYTGQLAQARPMLEQAAALYRPAEHGPQVAIFSSADPGMACLSHLALVLWLLGLPEQSLACGRRALELAERQAHPYSLAFVNFMLSWLHQYRQDGQAALQYAQTAVRVSEEQGFALLGAVSTVLGGWALAQTGQLESGIAQIFAGLEAYRGVGGQLGRLHFLALLAEAHARMEQAEEGLAVLAGAFAGLQTTGERLYEAELHRLKGELLWLRNEAAAGESAAECFRRAAAVARSQQARALELRAMVSLARLAAARGEPVAGLRAELAEICRTFPDGADTRDLSAARQLLAGLRK